MDAKASLKRQDLFIFHQPINILTLSHTVRQKELCAFQDNRELNIVILIEQIRLADVCIC